MLLDARYEDTGEGMNDQQLFEECAILFVAGHETSANALAWTWYLLAQHPDVVQKAREELATVLGDRQPTFEELPKLEYLSQIIEESMRVYPPAWITDRIAAEDDEWNGIKIAKGVVVVTYFYGAHHSPNYWQNPEQFDPERFSKENKKQHIPFAYSPFGGGPRLCIGNNFAIMEMQLVLATMLRAYNFELIPNQTVIPQPLITLRPKTGIWMNWHKK
jgi:cytochrome P450